MSLLQVTQADIEIYNIALPVTAITANSIVTGEVTSADNVLTGGLITTNEFRFIERIALEGKQMANTSNISGYSSIRIYFESLIGANTFSQGPCPWLQVSADGGTVYANSNNYSVHTSYMDNFTGGSAVQNEVPGSRLITFGVSNSANFGGCSGTVTLHGNKPGITTRYATILDYRSGESLGPWTYQERGYGRITQDNKITNYRIRMTHGDMFANGTLTIEGIPG